METDDFKNSKEVLSLGLKKQREKALEALLDTLEVKLSGRKIAFDQPNIDQWPIMVNARAAANQGLPRHGKPHNVKVFITDEFPISAPNLKFGKTHRVAGFNADGTLSIRSMQQWSSELSLRDWIHKFCSKIENEFTAIKADQVEDSPTK